MADGAEIVGLDAAPRPALSEAARFRSVGLSPDDPRQDFLILDPAAGQAVRLPVGPERFDNDTSMETVEHRVDALGPVLYPRGQQPYRVSWQGWLFGAPRRAEAFILDWQPPDDLIRLFDHWLRGDDNTGVLLYLTITDTPIANFPCFLLRFRYTPVGGYGDYQYEVEFVWARQVRLLTEAELTALLSGAVPTENPQLEAEAGEPPAAEPDAAELFSDPLLAGPDDPVPADYVVQSGDTLWDIARRTYGDGTVWRAVYAANRTTIGSNPDLIFPGMVLSLPPA